MKKHTQVLGAAGLLALAAATSPATADVWPDLPVGVKNGIAERIGDKLIVGLGSAGAKVFALDLNNKAAGWQNLSDFAGPAPDQPATAVSGGDLYVFSGSGKTTDDAASPIIFDTVSRYDPESDTWETLATKTPVGMLGASAATLEDGRIAIFGGYNKQLFDKYLSDVLSINKEAEPQKWDAVVNAYMGMAPKDYLWNSKVITYDPLANTWGDLGLDPSLPNTGSAALLTDPGTVLLINGEIKPGLRTDSVRSVKIGNEGAEWSELAPVPAPEGSPIQEGLAGAYAAQIGNTILVAGGANFPGARAAAEAGNWYAHEGLAKHWASEVFALQNGSWAQVGQLQEGLAYGGAFSVDDGLLIVGGEDGARAARTEVFLVKLDGDTLLITE